jgi:hypothetical protein
MGGVPGAISTARVIYAFAATEEGDLALTAGAVVSVLEKVHTHPIVQYANEWYGG